MAKPLKTVEDPAAMVVDKVLEGKLAELIGTTARALEHKRLTGIIPQGVWRKSTDASCTAWSDIIHGPKINGSPGWS